MKPQYDVNDNGHNEYMDPSKSYQNIDNTGNSNPTVKKRNYKNIESIAHIVFMSGIFLLLVLFLVFIVPFVSGKKLDDNKFYTSDKSTIVTNNIEFQASNYQKNNDSVTIDITIKNQSNNDVYLTAQGIYLASDNNVFLVSSVDTKNTSQFYGQAIKPDETIMATLTFKDVTKDVNKLIITNINDTKHLIWSNSISIK